MIRVRLPAHLRQLARCEREIQVESAATQRAVLDAIELSYPMLRGTMRDPATGTRRPFVRFFACERDLSHDPPDALLPDAVAEGTEPFMVIGAMAGGLRSSNSLSASARSLIKFYLDSDIPTRSSVVRVGEQVKIRSN